MFPPAAWFSLPTPSEGSIMAKATPRSPGGRGLQLDPKVERSMKQIEHRIFSGGPATSRKASTTKPKVARKPMPPAQSRKAASKRRIAAMVKGGRATAAQQASNKIAKKANARSIAKVGHRMIGSASAKTSRSSPINIRQAIKSAAPRTALRTFERSQAHAVKKARVGEKLAGRAGRQLARTARKTPLSVSAAAAHPTTANARYGKALNRSIHRSKMARHLATNVRPQVNAARSLRHTLKSTMTPVSAPKLRSAIKAPPVANRPIPLGRMGRHAGPALRTNLLKSRGVAATASVGAKLRARKLGRSLKSTASSAFHAPANLTSQLGSKVAGILAGKRLTARLKG